MITSKKGGASAASDMLLPGKAGGTVAVRRTLASTICRIADPTQVPRPRQLRDASTVMRFQPAHQSMINRRFDDRAPCLAWMSPKQALAGKPRIHSPASGIGGHESGSNLTKGSETGFLRLAAGASLGDAQGCRRRSKRRRLCLPRSVPRAVRKKGLAVVANAGAARCSSIKASSLWSPASRGALD